MTRTNGRRRQVRLEVSWVASRAHGALVCDGTAVAVLGPLLGLWCMVHGAEDGFNHPQSPLVLTAHSYMWAGGSFWSVWTRVGRVY